MHKMYLLFVHKNYLVRNCVKNWWILIYILKGYNRGVNRKKKKYFLKIMHDL